MKKLNKEFISSIIKNKFFHATFWMFVGVGVLSIGNYLYHLLMGRLLGPAQYGVLASIISISYLLSVPLLTFNLIIVKYVSNYKGKNDYESIKSFYSYLNKLFIKYGLILCLVLILLSPLITNFLHLSSFTYSILLVFFVFVGFFSILNKASLQGLSNFLQLAVTNGAEAVSKIILASLLVFIGLQAEGALMGIILAVLAGYLVAGVFLKKIKSKNAKPFHDTHLIGKYTMSVFITTLALTSLFTTDILLARHFLNPIEAGYYAALSVLGKIIFFAVSPINMVMFPFVSEKHSRKENYTKILFFSFGLTILGAGLVLLLYYLFPQIVVTALFGKNFIEIVPYVFIFGLFISIYSTCYLLANFFLSIHKTFVKYIVTTAAIFQIIGIYFYHSDITQIIYVSIMIVFLLLITLLLYYANEISRKNT